MRQHAQGRGVAVALLLLLTLFVGLWPITANAAEPTYTGSIELTGKYTGKFTLESSEMELFTLDDLMPGDVWRGKVNVTNTGYRNMEIAIVSIVNNLADDDLMFKTLALDIHVGEEEVYSGSYGATEPNVSKFYRVKPRETVCFDVEVTFPLSAGNECLSKKFDSTWTFEARYYGGGGGGTGTTPENPNIQTGHELFEMNTASAVWLFLIILCVVGATVTVIRIRAELKKNRNRNLSNRKGGKI